MVPAIGDDLAALVLFGAVPPPAFTYGAFAAARAKAAAPNARGHS